MGKDPKKEQDIGELPIGESGLPTIDDLSGEATKTRQTTTNLRRVLAPSSQRTRPTFTVLGGVDAGRIVCFEHDEIIVGRGSDCQLPLDEPGVSRRHTRFRISEGVVICEDLGSKNGTFVDGAPTQRRMLRGGDIVNIGGNVSIRFALMTKDEERLARDLYNSSRRDPLTTAYNRRYFSERLLAELAYAARNQGVVSVVMFDLDRFKALNDTHGHAAGDAVLRSVVQTAGNLLRSEDVLARVGGEEFAFLLRGVRVDGACAAADRLRLAIARASVPHDGLLLSVTLSAGVAASHEPETETVPKLLALADSRLYAAKAAGRDCVRGSIP